VQDEFVNDRRRLSVLRTLGVAVLAMAVALCASEPAAAGPDPVVSQVRKAKRAGKITGADSRKYIGLWKNSARVSRSLSTRRAQEVRAVRGYTLGMARSGRLKADRMEPVFSTLRATVYVMRHRSFPNHEQKIKIPGDPVVYCYFSGSGVQFHPLFTFAWGNSLYTQGRNAELTALADRAEEMSVVRNDFRSWEYYFPWQGGSPGWASGMSQATAVQVFSRAFQRSGDVRYRSVAERALVGFSRSPLKSGFTVTQGSGKWYLIYPFNSRQRILNGHLQVLLGVNDYFTITNDPKGQQVVQRGINGVVPMLRRFDTGAWSRYDLYAEAELGYHDLMTTQLTRLGNRTGVTQFSDRAARFANYRVTAPKINLVRQRLAPIYPVKDGYRDSVRLRYFVNKRAKVVVRIRSRAGKAVRTFSSYGLRGKRSIVWDGRSDGGRIVRPGIYTVHFFAKDVVGNRRKGQLNRTLRVRRDTRRPRATAMTLRSRGAGRSHLVVKAHDTESSTIEAYVQIGKRVLARTSGDGRLVLTIKRPLRRLHGRAELVLVDPTGNRTVVRL
jgi:hypothetical protein